MKSIIYGYRYHRELCLLYSLTNSSFGITTCVLNLMLHVQCVK